MLYAALYAHIHTAEAQADDTSKAKQYFVTVTTHCDFRVWALEKKGKKDNNKRLFS